MKGIVVKSTGSWYRVKTGEGELDARLKGKFKLEEKKITNPIAVGDEVELEVNPNIRTEWIITKIHERKNYIIRQSPRKKGHDHLLATNVDQAVLIATTKMPRTSLGFIDRFLVTLEAFRIPGVIIFNKLDLLDKVEKEELNLLMDRYTGLGYRCMATSVLKEGTAALLPIFEGRISLLSGHSGTGKSTLINLLVPHADQKISEVSGFANKGVHTTTFAEMFYIDEHSAIIDTPGIKELGLAEIEKEELAHYFPEMRDLLGKCRFHNCLHVNEPGCAVKEALGEGSISPERYMSYLSMLEGEDNRR